MAAAASIFSIFSRPFVPSNQNGSPASEPDSEPRVRKLKGSSQLNRWSRARSIRSGWKLDRLTHHIRMREMGMDPPGPNLAADRSGSPAPDPAEVGNDDGDGEAVEAAKSIYMVSDGTGWTAEHSVSAALGQFDYCLVDRGCPLDDVEQLVEVVKRAAKEGAMIIYSLADPSMAEAAKKACKLWGVPSADILGPITEAIASHLGVSPSGLPRWAPGRNLPLTDDYFRRIEAIEFTIKQDDGALPQNLQNADIVLAGVSRTGKTPLSIYLAQKGYKFANVPIVLGVQLPKTLFEVDPKKVFGLIINPVVLHTIRRARAKSLGFGDETRSNYSGIDHVREELEFVRKVFAQNPRWPVIEVTGKAIEETAAVVLRLYHDQKQKCSMPTISKHY